MRFKIIIFMVLNLIVSFAWADTKLTLASLESQNYKQMTGIEISKLLLNKTVKLKDLLSDAVYEIKIDADGSIKNRKKIKGKNPNILTSVEYHSRASLLSESVDLSIKGNKIITTDGIRTYMSTFYKKDNIIYGVRDIDNETVNFKIIIKK